MPFNIRRSGLFWRSRRDASREPRTTSAVHLFDALANDARYGLRMIRKSRGFSAVAIVSLAAGIGISTVIFSFANSFLFRPLHAANPSEIVQLFTSDFDGPAYGASSYADYEDFRDRSTVFSGLLASMRTRAALSDRERPELINGVFVSSNYFEVLGLQPSRGRFFLPDENRTPGTHPVVVLSHAAWQRRFGSDPDIAGRVIGLNGHAFTVIGVGPPQFAGTSIEEAAEFFVPVMMKSILSPDAFDLRDRRTRAFTVFGRLKTGASLLQADAALRVIAGQLSFVDPGAWRDRAGRGRVVTILPELEARFVGAPAGTVAWIFSSVLAGVVVLLGIACVNVATVLLARATTRRKEIAVRLAMGASRGRVVRQLLTECALLAAAGGALGLLLAQWVAALFARFRPDEAPPFELTLDYRILIFGIAASLLTIVLFGLAPALQSTRPDINAELKDAARSVRVRRFRLGLRDALVVVQVAVSVMLIIGAALLFRSYLTGRHQDPGFRRDHVLNVEVDLSAIPGGGDAQARFYREAVRAAEGIPGIKQAALAALVPLDGSNRSTRLLIDRGASAVTVAPDINNVGPGYFALMEIPVLRGREFTAVDRQGAPLVAVVNESMARQFWNGDAIGRSFRSESRNATVQIVGIVRDIRHRSPGEEPRPMVYFCADQQYDRRMTLHLRTAGSPAALGSAVQRTLHETHPAAAIAPPRTMDEYMDFVTMPQQLGSVAAAVTGMLELGLAVMALYGVIAFATAQRTREIGLRMALGASSRSVAGLIMRDGLTLAAVGIGSGVGASLAAAPIVGSLLVGVGAADPLSFGTAAVLLFVVAAIASYVPARRALRIDPSVALRAE